MVIYLDNNATTKVDKDVLAAMMPYFEEEYANPSSMYQFSVNPAKSINESRHKLKDFFGAKSEREVIFTSCGSESANTAIKGVLAANKSKKHIITTKVEHACVLNLYKQLEKQGYKVDYLNVNSNGELDLEELKEKITTETALVSVMWANNETGVIFPVEEIGEIINSFAAYPLQKGEYAEYRNFVKARLDNTDSVLYTFPGKELVPLDVGKNELRTFKTFLEPGDKLNIQAIFSEKVTQKVPDGYGGMTNQQVEVFRTETLFQDIMVADLLNQSGQSILDIYADYNDRTVWQQAQMDSSADFQESTEPQTLIVALTPEETERYYYYKSKSNAEFKVSLPQRTE